MSCLHIIVHHIMLYQVKLEEMWVYKHWNQKSRSHILHLYVNVTFQVSKCTHDRPKLEIPLFCCSLLPSSLFTNASLNHHSFINDSSFIHPCYQYHPCMIHTKGHSHSLWAQKNVDNINLKYPTISLPSYGYSSCSFLSMSKFNLLLHYWVTI